MNQKIKDLIKERKVIDKQLDKLRHKQTDIMFKIRDIQEAEIKAKLQKKFHVGDYFLNNIGLKSYHCDVLYLYEVLEVNSRNLKVREYKIGYSDGDYYTHIEKCYLKDYNLCNVGKKIKAKEFEELKNIIYNPESNQCLMENKLFTQLKFQALNHYFDKLVKQAEETNNNLRKAGAKAPIFKWTPEVPFGKTKLQHYKDGCEELDKLINEFTTFTWPDEEVCLRHNFILFINHSLMTLIPFSDKFVNTENYEMSLGMHELGTLDGTLVMVNPLIQDINDMIILYDVIRDSAVKFERKEDDRKEE